jgi:hypothetical protein
MGVKAQEQARVASFLNRQKGAFHFKYLGFPMSDKKLSIADLEPVVATIGKEWSLGRDTSCPRLQG